VRVTVQVQDEVPVRQPRAQKRDYAAMVGGGDGADATDDETPSTAATTSGRKTRPAPTNELIFVATSGTAAAVGATAAARPASVFLAPPVSATSAASASSSTTKVAPVNVASASSSTTIANPVSAASAVAPPASSAPCNTAGVTVDLPPPVADSVFSFLHQRVGLDSAQLNNFRCDPSNPTSSFISMETLMNMTKEDLIQFSDLRTGMIISHSQ